MATRSCREKAQKQNEQHQAILAKLLREEDNKYCADCEAKGTAGPGEAGGGRREGRPPLLPQLGVPAPGAGVRRRGPAKGRRPAPRPQGRRRRRPALLPQGRRPGGERRGGGGEAGRPRGRPPTRSRLSGLRSGAPRGLRVRAAAGLARFFLKFDGPSLPPAPAGVGQAGDLARPRRGAGAPRAWCWASEAMPFGVGSVPPAPGSLNLDVNRVGDPALVVNGILKIVSLSNLNLGLVW